MRMKLTEDSKVVDDETNARARPVNMKEASASHLGRFYGLFQRDNRSLAALMAKGASGTLVLRVINTGLGFLTAILLARMLGTKGYGTYAYAISWITVLGVFAKLGLDSVIGRFVAIYHHREDWPRLRGILVFSVLAVAAAGLLCLLVASAIAAVAYRTNVEMRNALWLAFALLPLNAVLLPCGSAQAGLHQVVRGQLPSLLIQPLLFLGLAATAATIASGAPNAQLILTLYLVAACASIAPALWFLRAALRDAGVPQAQPIYEWREWMGSAMPLMLMGSTFLLQANADILMLGAMLGPREAAIYKAATRGAELVLFILVVVNAPLAPMVARLYAAKDTARLQRLVTEAARVAFALGLPIAAVLILFGKWFLTLFGPDFGIGRFALTVLCLGQLASVLSGPGSIVLMMTGHERELAISSMLAAVLNVMLNFLFIPRWGMNGSACATAISLAAWSALLIYMVHVRVGLSPTACARSPAAVGLRTDM